MDVFARPIVNSPNAYPGRHWERENGLPTNYVVATRRHAELLSPIPEAKKQKAKKGSQAAIECWRIAVKVISHLGDEVMKVFRVE